MPGGIHGKILHVDLNTRATRIETPPDDMYRLLLGVRALVSYLLLRDTPAGVDPLVAQNLLIFAPGVLQGSNIPGSGRHAVGGKSPLTGALGSSEAGGWWGNEFKRTGYDALVVHGRSEDPVYLWIKDGAVEIRPAGHLWGLQTGPTQEAIRQEVDNGRVRVAQIGPAGENMVRYAAVMHDANRASGRNGLGAVMGSKNLKAVAVRGTRQPAAEDAQRTGKVTKWLRENYKILAAWAVPGSGRGTQDGLVSLNHMGGLPTRNFNDPVFEDAELLSGERNYAMFLKERDTCHACPISCKSTFQNEDDDPNRRLDPVYGGAEYESMASFGSACGVTDNLAVLKANELCNANGLDAISTGMSIAFVMECFENGFIDEKDTGGLIYRWGDGDLVVRSVELIAQRRDFGDVMAEGVNRMSQRFGPATQDFNMTVKGQELPMHEPRLKFGLGLGYAVAPVGADHMMNLHDTMYASDGRAMRRVNSAQDEKIAPVPANVLNEDKMKIFFNEVNFRHMLDCALICHFYPYDYGQLAELLTGVMGEEYDIHEVLKVGERAQTLARLFNLREGFTTEDDRIPLRVMKAFKEGPIAGNEIKAEDFAWAKRRYYEMMGWNPQTGVPSATCLEELGIRHLLESI